MNFKKSLAIVMTASLSVATLTGCSEETKNYTKDLAKVTEWESKDSKSNGTVIVEAKGVEEKISFTSTTYESNDKAYGEIQFTDSNGIINIPEIKMYTDGTTAYINKGYYEGLYTMSGLAIPDSIKNINAEYIGIDSGTDYEALKGLMTDSDSILNIAKIIFGDSDIDLPYVQNGNEYTIDLDTNETVDLGVKAIKAISNNLENLNSTYLLGLSKENIDSVKNAISDASFDTKVATVKDTLAGSTITSKEVFDTDKYTADINLNVQVKDLCNANVTVNSVTSKAEAKEITMPTSTVKFTAEEFQKLMGTQEAAVKDSALEKVIDAA